MTYEGKQVFVWLICYQRLHKAALIKDTFELFGCILAAKRFDWGGVSKFLEY